MDAPITMFATFNSLFQGSVQFILFHRREARLFYAQVTMYPNVISLHALRLRSLILPRLPVNVIPILYRRRRASHQYSPGESSECSKPEGVRPDQSPGLGTLDVRMARHMDAETCGS